MYTIRRISAAFLLLALAASLVPDASAQVVSAYATGWFASPTTGPTPGADWTPLPPSSNPLGPPNSNCVGTSNAPTVWAQFSYGSLGIPAGSTIEGIEVNVNYGSVIAPSMQLYLNGAPVGDTRTLPSTPPAGSCNASSLRTAGGPMDLWGTSLTAADFNTAGAVEVRLTRTTAGPDNPVSIDIESIQLVVYYDDGSNNDPDCSGGTISSPRNADASCQATISDADVTGVTDPDGDALTITVSPTTLALGGNSVTIMADDGNGGTCSKIVNVTVIDVTPPTITLNPPNPQTLECATPYTELGATVADNCDATPTLVIDASAVDANTTGSYPVTYNATDDSGNPATEQIRTVNVVDTTPPVITCPADVTLQADGMCQATYTGPPATATDACVTPTVSSVPPLPATFTGVSDNPIEYTASDGFNTSMCTQTVSVEDVTAPTITLVAGPLTLWSPNHKYNAVDLDDLITDVADNCDDVTAADVVTAQASSDEPENGVGDGNTTDDILLAGDCRLVELRAERQGGGNGRVYTLDLEATDLSMNVGMASFEVHVPHDRKASAVNDGPAYVVAGCAPPAPAARLATAPAVPAPQDDLVATPAPALTQDAAEDRAVAPTGLPDVFSLDQNYPNPFNPATQIRFGLPEAAHVQLVIFNVMGQEVARLVDQTLPAGAHAIQWDASHLPSGTYLYRFTAGSFAEVRRMVLLK